MRLLIHPYELGILSDSDKESFELHILECEECFNQLSDSVNISKELIESNKLKSLFAEKETSNSKTQSQNITNFSLLLKPAALVAVILLMIYPSYVGIEKIFNNSLRSVQEIGLVSKRANEINVFSLHKDKEILLSFLVPVEYTNSTSSLEIKKGDSEVIFEEDNFTGFDTYGVGRILLPSSTLDSGEYLLVFHSESNTFTFNFTIKN